MRSRCSVLLRADGTFDFYIIIYRSRAGIAPCTASMLVSFVLFVVFEQKGRRFCRISSINSAEIGKNAKKLLTKFSFGGKIYKLP